MTDRLPDIINHSTLMLSVLRSWAQAGWIRWLDAELADFLYQEARAADTDVSPLLLLAAALCSHQNGHGHLCLDLRHCLQSPHKTLLLPPEHAQYTPEVTPGALLANITLTQWQSALTHPLLCTSEAYDGTAHSGMNDTSNNSPLVIDAGAHHARLYLRRFWRYETQLAHTIEQKLRAAVDVNETILSQVLDQLFPGEPTSAPDQVPDWQKIACALSVRHQFAIITGGPGTGKTTTVVKLLALLQALHQASGHAIHGAHDGLRIKLAAPTGKAAARLSASITSQLDRLAGGIGIPSNVTTVHRLLGPVRHSRFFKHHAGNPLPADVVVIDEASMVDVELMAQLTAALPAHCRLILLGDKDQLASVEAGAVLGSLCARADGGYYSAATSDWVKRVSSQTIPANRVDEHGRALDQAITMLRYSHRFGAVPGIGELANAVNRGAGTSELQSLFGGQHPELQWLKLRSSHDTAFENLVCDTRQGYGHYLVLLAQQPPLSASAAAWDDWADTVLTAHSRFQLLAALRKSEWGVDALNTRIKAALQMRGLINLHQVSDPAQHDANDWYAGRPVMVTRNNYNLDLMNGDMGITLPYPNPASASGTALRVAFRDSSGAGKIRWILPTRLQEVETVFAMTVHKSQGSEFTHTALVLPAHHSPALTRELVYTGITRASRQFTLVCGDVAVLQEAVQARVFRAGGLEQALG